MFDSRSKFREELQDTARFTASIVFSGIAVSPYRDTGKEGCCVRNCEEIMPLANLQLVGAKAATLKPDGRGYTSVRPWYRGFEL